VGLETFNLCSYIAIPKTDATSVKNQDPISITIA